MAGDGKTGRRKTSRKDENQQQTKSTYGVDGRWRPINFQRTQIHFFSDVLTAVVVVVA